MNKTIPFWPRGKGDRIIWLTNWIDKIAGYQLILGYTAADIAATIADAQRALYLLNTVQTETQGFAKAVTTHIDIVHNGSGLSLIHIWMSPGSIGTVVAMIFRLVPMSGV